MYRDCMPHADYEKVGEMLQNWTFIDNSTVSDLKKVDKVVYECVVHLGYVHNYTWITQDIKNIRDRAANI